MLVVMKAQATPEEIQAVCEHIEQLGFRAHPLPGAQRTAIGITGNQGEVDRGNLEELSGVAEVIRVSKPYKLASRDVKEEDTIIQFPGTDATIGGRDLAIVAGPCSIESRYQAFETRITSATPASSSMLPRSTSPWLPVIPMAVRCAPGMEWARYPRDSIFWQTARTWSSVACACMTTSI